MDLKEQKYVCTLAECKSLTRASERLYISQPALSLYINNVEKNLGAKSGGAGVNTGNGYELEAIAACTIGGVSVNGGIGRISGVIIGVLVFEFLKTCLQYLGVDTNYQYIAQGIVIVVAIALDIRKYIAKK